LALAIQVTLSFLITGSLHACQVILEIAGEKCIQDQDNQGHTALHIATMGGHGDVVNFLLEKKGN
jgi:ankyrin repeat protein